MKLYRQDFLTLEIQTQEDGGLPHMDIEIKLFAGLAERLGTRYIRLELPDEADVSILQRRMEEVYPHAETQLQSAQVAVNKQYVKSNYKLVQTDEVALIPPVGGG
jgi:MoaE-MoaD fusion protein